MYSHHGYRSKDCRSPKFTAYAAAQLQRRHKNSTSDRHDGAAAGHLLEDLGHKDSIQLERLVHETFPTCNVDLIQMVNAPQMYGMYLLRKDEMRLTQGGYSDRELILYHVTTKSRAMESLKNGLDWRRTWRSKFGCGVSFSDDADYANYYANKAPKEDNRVIIVCAVMVNITKRVSGNHNDGSLIVPPGNADTTVSSNGRVYVKYNDYDFYPLYFVYYRRTPEHLSESKYFRNNNPHSKLQQNNRTTHRQQLQQQQQQQQQQELKSQREREQAQLQEVLRVRRALDERLRASRLEELQQKLRREEQEHRRLERDQELFYSRQAQARQRESSSNCLIL